jgi:hypothetical protein
MTIKTGLSIEARLTGRRANSTCPSPTALAAGSAAAAGPTVRVHRQRSSVGVHQKELFMFAAGCAHLQQRTVIFRQRHPNMHRFPWLTRSTVLTIATIRSIGSVSSCRWIG